MPVEKHKEVTTKENRFVTPSYLPMQRRNIELYLFGEKVWVEYLVVTLLVCISGNYAFNFFGHPRAVLVIVAFLFCALLLIRQTPFFSARFCFAITSFAGILVVQSILFSFFPTITIAGFLARMFIGYAAFHLVRNFPRVYINVLSGIVILSLCFYIPEQVCRTFGVDFRSFFHLLKNAPEARADLHLIVHNFHLDSAPYRNASFFWEPGAFAGYLLLALIFLGLEKEQFKVRPYWTRISVLYVGLLSTFSTTGYIVLPLALLLHFRLDGRTKAVAIKSFMLFYMLALSVESITYRSVVGGGSMKEKIVTQYTDALYRGGGRHRNRFDNLVADTQYIGKRPILGWGLNRKTRYMLHRGREYGSGHGEGLTDFIAKFGFTGLGIFTLCAWMGFMQLSGQNLLMSTFATLLILLMLNGECFLNFPLFLGLMFLEERQSQL